MFSGVRSPHVMVNVLPLQYQNGAEYITPIQVQLGHIQVVLMN